MGAAVMQGAAHPNGSNSGLSFETKDQEGARVQLPNLLPLDNLIYLQSHRDPIGEEPESKHVEKHLSAFLSAVDIQWNPTHCTV